MPLMFSEISQGMRLSGVITDGDVEVVAMKEHGPGSVTLTYRTAEGQLDERIFSEGDLSAVEEALSRRWSFDADGAKFRLASEARRMKWAHLADPFAAIDTSNIEPYPHQIDAVYNKLLVQKPLRFLLADDPGSGKTIMAGLLIRELMLRGDVIRCLVIAPGSLVEQWQDELGEKFGLHFEMMSRGVVEESRTGNPFIEKNFLIARVDQLARSEELIDKLKASEWDLVIVDEAHKMSAHWYGGELNKTLRFRLGEVLRDVTRHLLLMTATPHNGKNDDFHAFMALIDEDRFSGQLGGGDMPDVSDVMRRLVKENLLTFEGKRLFPERTAHSAKFELSEAEEKLYEAVTEYVRHGMNNAARMQEEGDKQRGLIIGFALAGLQRRLASSPNAIYHSLRRRCERLMKQIEDLRILASHGRPIPVPDLPKGLRLNDLEDFDFDDYGTEELEDFENQLIDVASAAKYADQLEAEVAELRDLVALADAVRDSGEDTKWNELRDLLRSDGFKSADSSGKLIVFTEHKDTLTYLVERIENELGQAESVVQVHGGVKRQERRELQDRFRVDPKVKVMVATDAAGEGVNLQVANWMVNYDLPWNPSRIEQRFGRIHRIGQRRPCHLWNLVAYKTREGQVFDKLFEKIEQQRKVYGDQVYDVLGGSSINISLKDLLIKAIREDTTQKHQLYMEEIINRDIGEHLTDVLNERALVKDLYDAEGKSKEIQELMEKNKARKIHPYFVESFFCEALDHFKGRITKREEGRFEITRVPARIRLHAEPQFGPVHERYERVTFDKAKIELSDRENATKAELISPGTPLLGAVVNKVLTSYSDTLQQGAVLSDPSDHSTQLRLLVYLDHEITDGRMIRGKPQVISRRSQYVEIDQEGNIFDPGYEPYIGYEPTSTKQRSDLAKYLDLDWANNSAAEAARNWAIENMTEEHFRDTVGITKERIAKIRGAVADRLESQIQSWDIRAEEIKKQELEGNTPPINSSKARANADDLAARMERRLAELDLEADIHNRPPIIATAALIVPQGLINQENGETNSVSPEAQANREETDRRAVETVMTAEKKIGRHPQEQRHNNPGFDIESSDPKSGRHYFIEVKGHLPHTSEISVTATQVQKAKSDPERWRLAVVSVPIEPDEKPVVKYVLNPFKDMTMHFAQTKVTLNVTDLLIDAVEPC